MATMEKDDSAPAIRFRRRKTTHPKRIVTQEVATAVSASRRPDAGAPHDAPSPPQGADDEEEPVPNLKEILRNRKRPRDRLKETGRKTEAPRTDLVPMDAPRPDQYTGRFVAQTGQVVDGDDKHMSEYVEARMAEKNHRQYGWPIPQHLHTCVAAIAPDLRHSFVSRPSAQAPSGTVSPTDKEHSNRLAAGQGRLQEVDLGPEASARIEQAWKRWDNGEPEPPASKARQDRYGYAWRKPRAGGKTDEDKKRDQMVEAVLQEAKLDYFDSPAPSDPRTNDSAHANTDDAVAEQFRTEYLESLEMRRRRRRSAAHKPAATANKGAPPPVSRPKMGGSKSVRAKMHKLRQEELAKKKNT